MHACDREREKEKERERESVCVCVCVQTPAIAGSQFQGPARHHPTGGKRRWLETLDSIQEDTGRTLLIQMVRYLLTIVTPAYQGRGTVPVQDTDTETLIPVQLMHAGERKPEAPPLRCWGSEKRWTAPTVVGWTRPQSAADPGGICHPFSTETAPLQRAESRCFGLARHMRGTR